MPIGRYFLYIGSVLLALLFVVDWYLPPPKVETARSDVDRSIIRIHSAHQWPKAVVFDTTLPTVPPPALTTAAAPAPPPPGGSGREAYAMAPEPAPATRLESVKPAKLRRTRTARAPAGPVAGSDTFGRRNDWFASPRREAFASRNDTFGSRGFWPMSW